MFDIGGFELVLIGIVALLVMGDDFPTMFRNLGKFTGKMRKMAREFSRAMEDAADDAGVKDVAKTLKTAANPKSMGLDALNKATDSFEKWEAGAGSKRTAKPKSDDVDAVAADTASKTPADKTAEMRATAAAAMSEAAIAKRDAEAADADQAELEPEPDVDSSTDAGEAKA